MYDKVQFESLDKVWTGKIIHKDGDIYYVNANTEGFSATFRVRVERYIDSDVALVYGESLVDEGEWTGKWESTSTPYKSVVYFHKGNNRHGLILVIILALSINVVFRIGKRY